MFFQNYNQVLSLSKLITNKPLDPYLTLDPPPPITPKLYHAIPNTVLGVPLENHPKILLLSPYLNCFRFELSNKTFISFS